MYGAREYYDRILRQSVSEVDEVRVLIFERHKEVVLKEGGDCLVPSNVMRDIQLQNLESILC